MSSSVEDEEGGSGSSSASLLASPKNSKNLDFPKVVHSSFQKPVHSSDEEDLEEKRPARAQENLEANPQIEKESPESKNFRQNTNLSQTEPDLEKGPLRPENKIAPNCVSTSNQTLEGRQESTEEDELIRFSDG